MISLPPIAQYLMETSICLLGFYLIYLGFLKRTTFFTTNRFYLLGSVLFSFGIPLLNFNYGNDEGMVGTIVYTSQIFTVGFNQGMETSASSGFSLTLGQILLLIYGVGVLLFSIRLIKRATFLYNSLKKVKHNPNSYCNTKADSFSFFNTVFIHPRHRGADEEWIKEHEMVHVRQWHSVDVILMELLTVLNWFNPIIHLFNRSLRETHEFIADEKVASLAGSRYEYAKLLVREVGKSIDPALYNTFASLIKKRLLMLSNENSPKRKSVRYLAVLPVVGIMVLLFSFNCGESVSPIDNIGEQTNEILDQKMTDALKDWAEMEVAHGVAEKKPDPVEEMPTWGKCVFIKDYADRKSCSDKEIIKFIGGNVKYPEAARKAGVEGMAVIQFVVEKNGSLSKFKVLKDPGSGLGDEALRVAKLMPKWTPGKDKGKTVAVEFVLPVKFKLGDPDAPKPPKPPVPPAPPAPPKAPNASGIAPPPPPPPPPAPPAPGDVSMQVETMPAFGDCNGKTGEEKTQCSNGNLINFIVDNLKYPKEASKAGVEGMAVVRFVVEKDGTTSGHTLLRDPGNGCGAEALRVTRLMNDWTPGIDKNGKTAKVQYTIPIKFKLDDKKDK